jgi:hypothetical protein
MAEEVLMRQAKVLAQRSGYSLEEARQSVSDTEAGRQLRDLANDEHRYVKAGHWQASVFWERAEERMMHHIGSEALALCSRTLLYSWLERVTWRGWEAGASTLQRACGVERGRRASRA